MPTMTMIVLLYVRIFILLSIAIGQPLPVGQDGDFVKKFNPDWIQQITTNNLAISPLFLEDSNTKSWFRLILNDVNPQESKFYCPYCNKYQQKFNTKVPAVANPYMDKNKCTNNVKIREHFNLATHKRALELYAQDKNPDPRQRVDNERGVSIATINMLKLVYIEVKANVPTENHHIFIELLKDIGANIGNVHVNKKKFNVMLEFISDMFHDRLKNLLTHAQACNMPLGLLLDGSQKEGGDHVMSISMITMQDNLPYTMFYRLLDYSKDMSAKGILSVIVAALKEDDIYDLVKNSLYGISSDGAAVMIGEKAGFITLLRQEFGRTNIYNVWCTSHRLQLVVGQGLEKNAIIGNSVKALRKFNNDIYSEFKNSAVKNQKLIATAFRLKKPAPSFSRIHDVRWMESELIAYKELSENYQVLVENLREVPKNLKSYATVAAYLKLLEDPEFLVQLHFTIDLLTEFTEHSLKSQKLELSLIDVLDFRTSIMSYLDRTDSVEFTTFWNGFGCMLKYKGTKVCEAKADDVEYPGTFTYQSIEFKIDDDIDKNMQEWRKEALKSLKNSLQKYFPAGAMNEFLIFLPKNLPDSEQQFDEYFSGPITQLNKFFKIGDYNLLFRQWKKIMSILIQHRTYADLKAGLPHHFWSNCLNIIGDDPQYNLAIKLIRIAIIIPSGTSEVERSFSAMNNIVTAKRSSMNERHVEDRLKISINGGSDLKILPFEDWAKKWLLKYKPADLETFHSENPKRRKKADFFEI